MAHEGRRLAEYASQLRYDDIPPEVLRRAKDCLIDAVAFICYGHRAAWSGIILDLVRRGGGIGQSHVLAGDLGPTRAESAALANGTLGHAMELDSYLMPRVGFHVGAVLVPAALATAQERQLGGKALLTAIVAGAEVGIRIGKATRHSTEPRGFHAPALTGPLGAAISAGHVFGLEGKRMICALGIAGSFSGGLLEFAASGEGRMVKPLHIGRAAESGVTAARLAEAGFAGPSTIVEGRLGFLNAYCSETDIPALTQGLGETYEIMGLCMKRYPCHGTSHTPIRAIELLRAEHGFTGKDVQSVAIEGTQTMVKLHSSKTPTDHDMARHSIPFSVAVALQCDTTDPDSFSGAPLHDPEMQALRNMVEVTARPGGAHSDLATTVRIVLKDGRRLELRQADYPGMPSSPLSAEELKQRFLTLTRHMSRAKALALLDRLDGIEDESGLDWLHGSPAK